MIERKKITVERRKPVTVKRGGGRIKRNGPKFDTLLGEFEDDPLGEVAYDESNLEVSATAEMNEIGKKIMENKRASQERFRLENETDYWLALCFQSQAQRDDFLSKTGWGDPGDRYINGLDVARRIGADVQPIELPVQPLRGKPKKFSGKEVI